MNGVVTPNTGAVIQLFLPMRERCSTLIKPRLLDSKPLTFFQHITAYKIVVCSTFLLTEGSKMLSNDPFPRVGSILESSAYKARDLPFGKLRLNKN